VCMSMSEFASGVRVCVVVFILALVCVGIHIYMFMCA